MSGGFFHCISCGLYKLLPDCVAGRGLSFCLLVPVALCVCLTCGALIVVSPCERAALSMMTASTSSKRLATCAASAKPSPATRNW